MPGADSPRQWCLTQSEVVFCRVLLMPELLFSDRVRNAVVMARQYLGVPATSASAERLFSIAGRSFDDLRQRMKEEMLEMLMWARINREKRWASRA